jgi:hypothetical protein
MKRNHATSLFGFFIVFLLLTGSTLRAGESNYYGVVESFGGGEVVVKTTKDSTGHWKIGAATKVEGSIARFDWVLVELGKGGHVAVLRFEERPAGRAGVVKSVADNVLTVHSGANLEKWNLTETTLGEWAGVALGDEVRVKLYGNHNLAEIQIVKHGVK